MLKPLWVFLMLLLGGCTSNSVSEIALRSLEGKEVTLSSLTSQPNKVLIFLSPECPLCQNYAVTIRNIMKEFEKENVDFVGVVSGKYYSDEQIRKYKYKYDLQLPIVKDTEFKLAKALDAKITPEVFLINKNHQVLYSGAIDNWAISLGRKRQTISAHYLRDAIVAQLNSKEVEIKNTEAIGCFIE